MASGTPRGIDHIGVTVPDLEAASRFLVDAFAAEAIYDNMTRDKPPFGGSQAERVLGLEPGGEVVAMRMMRLGKGPSLELFEMRAPHQRDAARPSDVGLQHVALYVDDIDAAAKRFEAAGGRLLTPPQPMLGIEGGDGNVFCYGRTPWGMVVELLSWPTKAKWHEQATVERYKPPVAPRPLSNALVDAEVNRNQEAPVDI